MRIVRRLIGLLFGITGLVGLLLCVAGIVGCWLLHSEVVARVDRSFGRAETALTEVQGSTQQVGARLRQTKAELESVRKREAEVAAQPPAERIAKRALSKKALEGMQPQLGETREMLIKANEVGLVVNGLLEALAELPLIAHSSVDTDRLKQASTEVSDLTQRASKLSNLLEKVAPPGDSEVVDETSRAENVLDRVLAVVDDGSEKVSGVHDKVAHGHARVIYWINVTAWTITAILLWIGVGQFSLLVHGVTMTRRRLT